MKGGKGAVSRESRSVGSAGAGREMLCEACGQAEALHEVVIVEADRTQITGRVCRECFAEIRQNKNVQVRQLQLRDVNANAEDYGRYTVKKRDADTSAETEEKVLRYPMTKEMNDRIEKTFTYHAPRKDQVERYESIRANAESMACLLVVSCPPSRELSLALTKLEECVMHANASIARNESAHRMPTKPT